jgi:predicted secreted Zn-dependent protease
MYVAVLAFQVATYTLPPIELPNYVSETSDIVWYPISGATLNDLQSQMRDLGPRDQEGAHAGYTRNSTYWHVTFRNNGGNCWMSAVQVTAFDTVTLPTWAPPPRADPAMVAEWSRFVTMLGRHEEGHRQIAIDGASEIARALAALSSRASCDQLLADANAQGHAILASTRQRQKAYDAETNHGLRRGTRLEDLGPPPSAHWPWLVIAAVIALVIAALARASRPGSILYRN